MIEPKADQVEKEFLKCGLWGKLKAFGRVLDPGLISNSRKIMRKRVNERLSNWVGWMTVSLMTLSAIALLVSLAT